MRSTSTRKRWRCPPSHPGSEGAGAEAAVDDADAEIPRPAVAREEEEPALPHAIVCKELRPPTVEVALPLAVVVDLDVKRQPVAAAFLHDGAR
jgi:hypothetical protein